MRWQIVFVVAFVSVLLIALRANGLPLRTAGVNVGDWAHYLISHAGNSTAIDMGEIVNWTAATFTVLAISGTNVTMQGHAYHINGSDFTETGWIDVDTGQSGGNATDAGTLISANLMQGDLVYTTAVAPFYGGTINETISRGYMGSPVDVNHYVVNTTSPPNPILNATYRMDWYWYKATGVPTEITMNYMEESSLTLSETNYEENAASNVTWFSWSMTIASIIPEFPTAYATAVFMIATLLVVTIYRRKHTY
jgi:hypothetical protein